MGEDFVQFPWSKEAAERVAKGFHEKAHGRMPEGIKIIGFADGSHCKCSPPAEQAWAYVNRSGHWHSFDTTALAMP